MAESCEYCEVGSKNVLLEQEYIDPCMLEFVDIKSKTRSELVAAFLATRITFVDRGYLRSGNKTDVQCLEHGSKIKINFCPMCGREL